MQVDRSPPFLKTLTRTVLFSEINGFQVCLWNPEQIKQNSQSKAKPSAVYFSCPLCLRVTETDIEQRVLHQLLSLVSEREEGNWAWTEWLRHALHARNTGRVKRFPSNIMRNVKRKNIVKMERDVRGERGPMQAMAREKAVKGYFLLHPKFPSQLSSLLWWSRKDCCSSAHHQAFSYRKIQRWC